MSTLPASLLADLTALSAERGAALFVRHGERGELPHDLPGDHIPLTAAGRAQAAALGQYLGARLGAVRTSAVLRCRQTAEAILTGAGRMQSPEEHSLLGAPGPFVLDGEQAWPLFLQHGVRGLARLQLRGDTLPGLRALREGCALLLRAVRAHPLAPGQINLYVTHDVVIGPLAAFLLGESDPDPLWPDFLEGLLLWPASPGLAGAYRGRVLSMPSL